MTPEQRRDVAIASAAQAFALLCEKATEALQLLIDEMEERQ